MSRTKEDMVNVYLRLKAEGDGTRLLKDEFLKRSGITDRELESAFGSCAYSRLQDSAGDPPNRLNLRLTPISEIMAAYGRLALDVLDKDGRLPVAADWRQRGLRPTESGLSRTHKITWTVFPRKFADFCANNPGFAAEFPAVLQVIKDREGRPAAPKTDPIQGLLDQVCTEINGWAPAIRRNWEEAYKSELSLYLRNASTIAKSGLDVREERGDSQCDIAIGRKIAIELKKAPTQSDYDRCFGQVARHLQTYDRVIVVIFDVSSRDRFEDFNKLVDQYFHDRVRVLRHG